MGDEAIYVAASGALVQEMRLEVLSNNLANIETVGFKEDRSVFSNYISGDQNRITNPDPEFLDSEEPLTVFPYLPVNDHVKFEGTKINFSQGSIRQTGNRLDFALEGNGFFCVETPTGIEQYTRKGNFKLNGEGNLVTQDGLPVLGSRGASINIDGKDITVDEKGNISVDGTQVDTLKVVNFDQPYSLIKAGDSLFFPADPAVTATEADDVRVSQGSVELSNVNPVKVMTEMIEVHRAFESYQKVIRSMDDVVSESINEVGRVV
jgi:flagellar basal-body rod protein FlgG